MSLQRGLFQVFRRDRRGHFATKGQAGKPCRHACCRGRRPHPPGFPVLRKKKG